MSAYDYTIRAYDSAGRIKQPCPHCGDIEEQEFVRQYTDELNGCIVELWHCPRGKAEGGARRLCYGGTHSVEKWQWQLDLKEARDLLKEKEDTIRELEKKVAQLQGDIDTIRGNNG